MSQFDEAVQAVITGDVDELEDLLDEEEDLVKERSSRGATLLHYVAANSPVEDQFQKTPENVVEIAKVLFDAGAEPDAIIEEDSGSTPLVGLVSSSHTAKAGVQGDLVDAFIEAGAAVNGIEDDGYPLSCALWFNQKDAAEALVRHGARVDNLVLASGIGNVDMVRKCFDDDKKAKPAAMNYLDPFRRKFDEQQIFTLALHYARRYGHEEVAKVLVENIC